MRHWTNVHIWTAIGFKDMCGSLFYFVQLLLFLYRLLHWAFHSSTEDRKKIPHLKNSLLVWKNSNHSCLIKIAECIKIKSRSGWVTKMRNLSFGKNSLGKISHSKLKLGKTCLVTIILLLYVLPVAENFPLRTETQITEKEFAFNERILMTQLESPQNLIQGEISI